MATTKKINANGTEISVLLQGNENDYSARNTIGYLGVWEQLHNPNFNPIEFGGFRN